MGPPHWSSNLFPPFLWFQNEKRRKKSASHPGRRPQRRSIRDSNLSKRQHTWQMTLAIDRHNSLPGDNSGTTIDCVLRPPTPRGQPRDMIRVLAWLSLGKNDDDDDEMSRRRRRTTCSKLVSFVLLVPEKNCYIRFITTFGNFRWPSTCFGTVQD